MNQQPDELFRRKLDGYQRPAPASAWEKIAAARVKKNTRVLWIKIAASLVVPAMIGYGVWQLLPDGDTQGKPLATNHQPAAASPQPKPAPPQPKIAIQPATSASAEAATVNAPETQPANTRVTYNNKRVPKQPDTNVVAPASEQASNTTVQPQLANVPAPDSHAVGNDETAMDVTKQTAATVVAVTVQDNTTSTKEGQTFTYTAQQADMYLDKQAVEEEKKALADATSTDKKASTLKKLLQKADDLKNNQDPVGELRQMKNEILALNFKTDKQRGQNK